MKRIFITGTDTNCGKTYVLCSLLSFLLSTNQSAIGLKPVASGCLVKQGELWHEDVEKITIHNPKLTTNICQLQYEAPIAPHIAAQLTQNIFSASDITRFCTKPLFNDFEYVLIEGAGGLITPLNATETWIDFIQQANLEVILVVGMRLGCINHALLTDVVFNRYQIPCVGWVANCIDKNMLVVDETIQTLQDRMRLPYLATISYQGYL